MTAIIDIHGRQILDSRGNPTVEVDVLLEDGSFGPLAAVDIQPIGSPYAPYGLRYLSLAVLPNGRERLYYEATRAAGAHELRSEMA